MTHWRRLATIPLKAMHDTTERRTKPRVAADLATRLGLGGQFGSARIRDISSSGIRCVTDRALPLMTQVELVIVLPHHAGQREIVCRGAVVRSGPLGGSIQPRNVSQSVAAGDKSASAFETAIFFTDIRDSDRVQVDEFVSSARPSARL